MSSSINQVTILGRLGADPNLKAINGQTHLCLLSVATDSEFKDRNGQIQKDVQWHKVTIWGAQANPCAQFLHKGDKVCITGSLKYSEYEQNGIKLKSVEIVAKDVVFLGQRQQTSAPQQQPQQPQNGWSQPQQPQNGWPQPQQQQNGWPQPQQQQNQQPQNGWSAQSSWGQPTNFEDVPF